MSNDNVDGFEFIIGIIAIFVISIAVIGGVNLAYLMGQKYLHLDNTCLCKIDGESA